METGFSENLADQTVMPNSFRLLFTFTSLRLAKYRSAFRRIISSCVRCGRKRPTCGLTLALLASRAFPNPRNSASSDRCTGKILFTVVSLDSPTLPLGPGQLWPELPHPERAFPPNQWHSKAPTALPCETHITLEIILRNGFVLNLNQNYCPTPAAISPTLALRLSEAR